MTDASKRRDYAGLKVIGVRVIAWEPPSVWGLAVDYEGGKRLAYEVGSKDEAEAALRELTTAQRQ